MLYCSKSIDVSVAANDVIWSNMYEKDFVCAGPARVLHHHRNTTLVRCNCVVVFLADMDMKRKVWTKSLV